MKPVGATIKTLRLVSAAIVGELGEVHGGPNDGAQLPPLVVAQLGLLTADQAGRGEGQETIVHLGLTQEAALDLAHQLEASAGRLAGRR